MSEEEIGHLMLVYRVRRRNFFVTFITAILIAYVCSFPNYEDPVTRGMHLAILTFFELPIIITGLLIYLIRIRPYLRDARNGVKDMIPYEIIRFTYFPQTNQYFISFDDPRYMHHEVDEVFYFNCTEGDYAYVSRAPISKYVFDQYGRFTLV
jgi:hypothetical protein